MPKEFRITHIEFNVPVDAKSTVTNVAVRAKINNQLQVFNEWTEEWPSVCQNC